MSRSFALGLGLCVLLGWSAAALAATIARHFEHGGRLRLELARTKQTALAPATLERFERLTEKVLVTYYVSRPERMPSALRHLEREVTDLLAALHARFPERFDYQVVDPESRPGLEGFAARRRVAPFRLRSVTRDAWDERTVWSTLSLSCGARPPVLIPGVVPEHLPTLQSLLVTWLDELETPRVPRLALAADDAGAFEELADELAARGSVVLAELDSGEPIPEVDCLLWMRPRAVTSEQLLGLERLLERGGSVIVAGSGIAGDYDPTGEGALGVWRTDSAADEVLAHFGLVSEGGLVLDSTCEEIEQEGSTTKLPFVLRCIAPNQDFHTFATQPNGTLYFQTPTPIAPEAERLRALGWNAAVLATSSDETWVQDLPPSGTARLPRADLTPALGRPVAKQALLVGLFHDDPRRGRFFACSAETPFVDGGLARPHAAHRRLLDVLLDEATSPERLVLAAVPPAKAAPLPELSAAQRLLLRLACVGVLPLALLVLALGRGVFSGRSRTARGFGRSLRRSARVGAVGVVALVLVRGAAALDWRADLTSGRTHALARESAAIGARSGEHGPVAVELWRSARERLPPGLALHMDRLVERLRDFERAGARLELARVDPDERPDAERAALAARGVAPFQTASEDEEVTRVRRFYAHLRLARGEAEVWLGFPDERAFELAEYRLAFALARLDGARVPRVAFASDVPRLSAAEAYEQFQQKGLFAPRGADVYSLARETLELGDLEVEHVNPRGSELALEDANVLVWLQPRRSIEPMLEETVRFLHGGGSALLAAQHFTIQSQQFRGADFELKYWPRPQLPDVDLLYFPELSIELVREVLFDELSTPIVTETQLTGRRAGRDVERQTSALPFLIRASTANFAHASPITAHLGDQSFPWANRLRWDPARLSELGLAATPLVLTSERCWSFPWTAGWIPPEVIAGPSAAGPDSPERSDGADEAAADRVAADAAAPETARVEVPHFLGRQPLAVLFEGTFPRPTKPLSLTPPVEPGASATEPPADARPERPWPAPAPGRLLFLGGSELFKNERLLEPAFRADQLLWNAVAALAFEPELAAIATRRTATSGTGYVAPSARLAWRAYVVGAGPACLVALGALLALLRSRVPERAR